MVHLFDSPSLVLQLSDQTCLLSINKFSFRLKMLRVARRLIERVCGHRALSVSALRKTSNIADYKLVDHAYDAVVVGAGTTFFVNSK